nr:hypothetical protein [uncultured Bdellovibrio sp.]
MKSFYRMIPFFFFLVTSFTAFAGEPIPAGCTASRNFSAYAYKVWISKETKQTASEEASQSANIPVNKKIELQLHAKQGEFKGFVNFEIPEAGSYVIVTDAYPHMDITELTTSESLNPTDFGKIRDCGTVSKALRFEFAKPGKFLLGFTSGQGPILNVLIWKL